MLVCLCQNNRKNRVQLWGTLANSSGNDDSIGIEMCLRLLKSDRLPRQIGILPNRVSVPLAAIGERVSVSVRPIPIIRLIKSNGIEQNVNIANKLLCG